MPRQISWTPVIESRSIPLYQAIANALANDISSGRLEANARLPTHRELAWELKCTVGTITRAYAEAQRRGLIYGEVGRGSFVRTSPPIMSDIAQRIYAQRDGSMTGSNNNLIDLGMNWTAQVGEGELLRKTLQQMAEAPETAQLLDYGGRLGHSKHRRAAAQLLARRLGPVDIERLAISAGTQHALTSVLSVVAEAGDTVLVEDLTYPGMLSIARMMRLKLKTVESDAEGPLPDSFDAHCRATAAAGGKVKAFYLVATLHNPTGRSLSPQRVKGLIDVARRHDVPMIEDDIYAFLMEEPPPPIYVRAAEYVFYVTGMSKFAAPGLRIGYIVPPARFATRLSATLAATSWMASTVSAEICARWIDDGTLDEIIRRKRAEARERLKMTGKILGNFDISLPPAGYHVWLKLPEPWRARDFAAALEQRGVLVTPGDAFVAGRAEAPHAVRLCLGNARSREELAQGLNVVAEALSAPPMELRAVV